MITLRPGADIAALPDVFPSGLELFVDHVIPILGDRGLFRREYTHSTPRGHLGL